MPAAIVKIKEQERINQESDRQAKEGKAKEPATHASAATEHEEAVKVNAPEDQRVNSLEALKAAVKSQHVNDGEKQGKPEQQA